MLIYRECHVNLALCEIKLTNFESAVEVLSAVLYYEPLNAKALYLRAKCHQVLQEYENAILDLKEAARLRPQDVPLLQQYREECQVALHNRQQDDPMLSGQALLKKAQQTQMRVVVKDKRGGLMQDGEVQKSIDEILNLKKPRSLLTLLRMVYTVTKNFAFSLNAFLLSVAMMVVYHYVVKKKVLCKAVFKVLDRVA